MTNQNIFGVISDRYYQLTNSEKKIADIVISLEEKTQFMSISELSEICGVADATISRFCRNLGYNNYSSFKLAISNSNYYKTHHEYAKNYPSEPDSFKRLCQNVYEDNIGAIQQTLNLVNSEAISTVANVLLNSQKIYCMGQGGSGITAQEVAHLFSTTYPGYYAVTDSHLQSIAAVGLSRHDAVLYFSYSGSIRSSEEVLQIVKNSGAKIILITRFPKSPTAAFADYVLQCGSNETPREHGSVAAKIAQLFLMNILLEEMRTHNVYETELYREKIAEALASKHI